MRRILPAFTLITVLSGDAGVALSDQGAAPAVAQPATADPSDMADSPISSEASAAAPATDLAGKVEAVTPKPPAGSPQDLVAQVEMLKAKLADYKAASEPSSKRLALLGLLASLTWALLAAVNRFRDLSDRGKAYLPYAAVLLGVIAGVIDAAATGTHWVNAVITGIGPPLAVLFHELLKRWAKPKAAVA